MIFAGAGALAGSACQRQWRFRCRGRSDSGPPCWDHYDITGPQQARGYAAGRCPGSDLDAPSRVGEPQHWRAAAAVSQLRQQASSPRAETEVRDRRKDVARTPSGSPTGRRLVRSERRRSRYAVGAEAPQHSILGRSALAFDSTGPAQPAAGPPGPGSCNSILLVSKAS